MLTKCEVDLIFDTKFIEQLKSDSEVMYDLAALTSDANETLAIMLNNIAFAQSTLRHYLENSQNGSQETK